MHARAKQVTKALVDFYGDDEPPEVRREDEYLAASGTDARFRHEGETVAGLLYGERVATNAADPDLGVLPFRMVAHEAAHSISGVKPGPLPGFSQTVEEGGAEILSLWFWKHRGQQMDHRDASRVEGKWTEGARTLAHSAVYRKEISEVVRRAASNVGWDRQEIVDEVEAAMRTDHYGRLAFRDSTHEAPVPPGVEDTPEGVIEWLLADERVVLKGNWAMSPTAEAEVRQTIGDLLDRYPLPFRHIEAASWVDEINQYAGKSHDTIHVSPNFLDDEHAAAREREWRGLSKAGEFGRPGTIVHEFGHIIDGHLLSNDRAASAEIEAFLDEPVPGVGGMVPRIKAGLEAPSPYGAENKFEFFAEAFTDWYFNGESAHPSSVAIGRVIDRALRARVAEEWTLSPEALRRKAERQLRDRTGRWRTGGLTPGVGRRAPGWMERDLNDVRATITDAGPRPSRERLEKIGEQVEKVAKRFSVAHKLHAEGEAARVRHDEIFTVAYDRFAAADFPEAKDVREFMSPEEVERYDADRRVFLENLGEMPGAERRALVDTLRKLRPMGGALRVSEDTQVVADEFAHDELPDIHERLAESLAEVSHVLPSEWIENLNAKGEVRFRLSTERAYHMAQDRSPKDEWEAARDEFERLGSEGYEFLGRDRKYPTFLAWRRPDGEIIALRSDGQVMKGIGDFSDTELIMDRTGEWQLPLAGVDRGRPSPEDLERFIEPMENLPPEHFKPSPGSAMGPDWDPWKEMRAAVAEREAEGWAYVGRRGKWATLRKDGEEIWLDWGGNPHALTDTHTGDRQVDPLNPYGQIPLPAAKAQKDSLIQIDPKDTGTLLHELAHRVERNYGEETANGYTPMMNAQLGFLRDRRGIEPLRKLRDITGNSYYDDHEVAFEDQFVTPYIGKDYSGNASEVLTMGLQMVFYPSHHYNLEKDPKMRHFILGMLAAL